MAQTLTKIKTRMMREYYGLFSKYSKGRLPEKKVAWITSFAPVEILEALGILYYYPESYAAVTAASQKEQSFLYESRKTGLSEDCCSYAGCFEGCIESGDGPRGVPPKPDILIAANNQCNTLPGWWNMISRRYDVPLIMIDYPGESASRESAYQYVRCQYRDLVAKLEKLTGNTLEENRLMEIISNSKHSVKAWSEVTECLSTYNVRPTILFDDIAFLINSRCKPDVPELYRIMKDMIKSEGKSGASQIPLYWIGYPLWYHEDRYLSELLDGFKIVGSNYITWWNLDYSGKDAFEKLYNAYNFTFLNLTQESRNRLLKESIKKSGALCALSLHNKSCKCDFVSAKNIDMPQVEIEMDMVDRTVLDLKRARTQIDLLKELVCGI